ncbi:allantoicase [Oricola sp.]|uniref:allantoicase n=1 Tax=Oricola sp. TaxID=1979950 RepID=UPI0025FBB5E3|nr:allantoicase [Oricola sp.]MCI5077133.1 allantoicase [Oricola sp.]
MDKNDFTRPEFATRYPNLASAGLGAKIVSVTDDFFAEAPRMLDDADAVFIPDKYDDNGKWMDGWESRRKRGPGHDHVVVALAAPTVIRGFDVDTAHFTGNYPPACSIEACALPAGASPDDATEWQEIVAMTPLGPSAHHYIAHEDASAWTHVRLHIYPDGGVARLRVYGLGQPSAHAAGEELDLASLVNGARIVAFSDAHYGNYHRMLTPTASVSMGDGWETHRRREPGNEWIIVALAAPGHVDRTVIDTAFYKGNCPVSCSIDAAYMPDALAAGPDADQMLVTASMYWEPLLDKHPLNPDRVHEFNDILPHGPITHVRVNIHPDGGVARFKLFGRKA